MQDRLLLYGTSENPGQRGISGPCLKMLRFFVKHTRASTHCFFLMKRCVIVSSHILALRERMIYSVLRNASQRGTCSSVRSCKPWSLRVCFSCWRNRSFWLVGSLLVLVCAGPGPRGAHFYVVITGGWVGGAGVGEG